MRRFSNAVSLFLLASEQTLASMSVSADSTEPINSRVFADFASSTSNEYSRVVLAIVLISGIMILT